CAFLRRLLCRHESVTISQFYARCGVAITALRSSLMIGLVRAATLCATLALGLVTALAADKAFKRDYLADSAIKLEAQIKSEAGPGSKSPAAPKKSRGPASNSQHLHPRLAAPSPI